MSDGQILLQSLQFKSLAIIRNSNKDREQKINKKLNKEICLRVAGGQRNTGGKSAKIHINLVFSPISISLPMVCLSTILTNASNGNVLEQQYSGKLSGF